MTSHITGFGNIDVMKGKEDRAAVLKHINIKKNKYQKAGVDFTHQVKYAIN